MKYGWLFQHNLWAFLPANLQIDHMALSMRLADPPEINCKYMRFPSYQEFLAWGPSVIYNQTHLCLYQMILVDQISFHLVTRHTVSPKVTVKPSSVAGWPNRGFSCNISETKKEPQGTLQGKP